MSSGVEKSFNSMDFIESKDRMSFHSRKVGPVVSTNLHMPIPPSTGADLERRKLAR